MENEKTTPDPLDQAFNFVKKLVGICIVVSFLAVIVYYLMFKS